MAGGMRRTRNVRSRVAAAQRARQAPVVQEEPANDLDTDDDDIGVGGFDEEEDETLKAFNNKKIGTKKLRRLQEKAEKKAQREVCLICVAVARGSHYYTRCTDTRDRRF